MPALSQEAKRARWDAESRKYFRQLGLRITDLRNHQGMTQAELGRSLGVSQQAVFAYELGERRISIFGMLKLARILRVSVNQLLGIESMPVPVLSPDVSPSALRHARRIVGLSRTERYFVRRVIDSLEATRPES